MLSNQVICRLLQPIQVQVPAASQATREHVWINLMVHERRGRGGTVRQSGFSHQRGCSAWLRRGATCSCRHQQHQGVLAPEARNAAGPRCSSAGRPPPGTVPDTMVIRVWLSAEGVQDMHAPAASTVCVRSVTQVDGHACCCHEGCWHGHAQFSTKVSNLQLWCSPGGQLVGDGPQGGWWRREAQRRHRRHRAPIPAPLQRQRGAAAIVVGVHGRRAGGRQRQRLAAVRPGSHWHVRSRLAVGPARHSGASFSTAVKGMQPEARRIMASMSAYSRAQ